MANNTRAHVELTASATRFERVFAGARSMVSSFAASVSRGIGQANRAAGRSIGKFVSRAGASAVGNVVGNLAGRGFDALAESAHDVRNFERTLIRLGIAGDLSNEALNKMRTQIRQVSRDTGVADSEILQGAQTYVDLTGDIKGASTAMSTFARISQASGASVSDVASASAALQQSMGLDASQIESVFSGLIVQGKAGAVSLKDMASELSTLAPMMAQFAGGASVEGIRSLGAAFQVVRRGSGSAAEASVKLQNLFGTLIKQGPRLERVLGKGSVFKVDAKGRKSLQDFDSIIKSIGASKLMTDPTLLGKVFGNDKESNQALRLLTKEIALYDELKAKATDTGAVQRDLDTFLQSDAGKIDKAWNNLKVTLAEVFTPARIATFASALGKVVDMAGKLVGFIEKVADKVDDIVDAATGGDKEERQLAKRSGDKARAFGKNMTPQQKKAFGDQLMQEGAEMYSQIDGASKQRSVYLNAMSEELRKVGQEMREQGDIWGEGGSQAEFDRAAGKPNLVAAGKMTPEQAMQIFTSDIAFELKRGIKDALGELRIEVGGDKIVNATRKSGANNTRPPQ